MSSARKFWTNRQNAQRSTGPRSPAGKVKASRNATKHGLNSRSSGSARLENDLKAFLRQWPNAISSNVSRIAEAQCDLLRVRRARRELLHPVLSIANAGPHGILIAPELLEAALTREPQSSELR